MDFSWSPAQKELFDGVLAFARGRLSASPHDLNAREQSRSFSIELWRACGEYGLPGLAIAQEHGGAGLDCLSTARALEALGQGTTDGGLGFSLCAHLLACAVPLSLHGSPEQQARWLPRLCTGEWIGANAITESQAGSDVFSLAARAHAQGDEFVLSGEKLFVTNGPVAEVLLVYAATQPERGFLGVSAFVVQRDTPGLRFGKPLETTGLTTAPLCSVYLDECRVPKSALLGKQGTGGAIFMDSMAWERSCLFAFWLGTMQRQLDETIAQAKARRQFGRAIGSNQAVSHKIADMKLRLEAARLLLYQACWRRAQHAASELDSALAKLAVSEAFVQSSLDAVQIFGGMGVLRETGVERYLRDAVCGTVYSGTSEMQREIIARELGLPVRRRGA
jgi:L-prolyl-PCP dehydrogenase